MARDALLLALACVGRAAALKLGAELGRGNYGVVYAASVGGLDAVAKCAAAAEPAQDDLARQYLDVEASVNAELRRQAERRDGTARRFCTYLGERNLQGTRYLLWERVHAPARAPPGIDVRAAAAVSLADFSGRGAAALEQATGLTPRALLRALLLAARDLHAIGYVHRDIKPANLLLDWAGNEAGNDAGNEAGNEVGSSGVRLRLIDLGSCAYVEGCSAFDEMLRRCPGYDETRSPVSPRCAPDGR